MAHAFKIGDHVRWNSEAGEVSGRIVRVHARDVPWKCHIHRCGDEDPQYGIRSDRSGHVALRRGGLPHKAG